MNDAILVTLILWGVGLMFLFESYIDEYNKPLGWAGFAIILFSLLLYVTNVFPEVLIKKSIVVINPEMDVLLLIVFIAPIVNGYFYWAYKNKKDEITAREFKLNRLRKNAESLDDSGMNRDDNQKIYFLSKKGLKLEIKQVLVMSRPVQLDILLFIVMLFLFYANYRGENFVFSLLGLELNWFWYFLIVAITYDLIMQPVYMKIFKVNPYKTA